LYNKLQKTYAQTNFSVIPQEILACEAFSHVKEIVYEKKQ